MDNLIKKIQEAKEKTQKETGSFKYDFAYDECLEIIKNYDQRTKKTN
jgi:hypothetical protein